MDTISPKSIASSIRRKLQKIAKEHNGHYQNQTTIGIQDGYEWTAQYNIGKGPDGIPFAMLLFFVNGRLSSGATPSEAIQTYQNNEQRKTKS